MICSPYMAKKPKIEKNIPIPPSGWEARKEKNPLRAAAQEMKPMDSVVCDNIGMASRFVGYLKEYGFTGTMRKLPEGTIRVWKIDPNAKLPTTRKKAPKN